jgi:signal transduction histidine kinase
MGTMTDITAPPRPRWPGPQLPGPQLPGPQLPGPQLPGSQAAGLQPPDEITRSLFGRGRRVARSYPLAIDALGAALLLAPSTLWLVQSPFAGPRAIILQTALIAALAARRLWPDLVFLLVSAIAFVQWLLDIPLLGDAALLVALYTVAAHRSHLRALLAAGLLEAGAVMAAIRWEPAGTLPRSLAFLTATVVAALFAGLTAASGSKYLAWMEERARRLEIERDQQAVIATAAERTRIARELHDIVSHSLSVVITLADAAAVVSRADPDRSAEAMTEVSEVGRHALSDMRAMLGVLRTEEPQAARQVPLPPQPGVAQLDALIERVRATGLAVDLAVEGTPFPLGAAAELTAYRIVQEALTNTIRHAAARRARVTIGYDRPRLHVRVADDGTAARADAQQGPAQHGVTQHGPAQHGPAQHGPAQHGPTQHGNARHGHGIDGMRERASMHGGALRAGPGPDGGWLVTATLYPGPG